ncbi:MAG: glycosyltransferase family 2 protein [Victivallaceae bacterium]|nr:glycosyltransferase family 2 protein [Victivallaceae bacterium]
MKRMKWSIGTKAFVALIAVCIAAVCFLGFFYANPLEVLYTQVDYALAVFGIYAALASLTYFLIVSLGAFFYRAAPTPGDDELPTCTVLIPAYNEGKQVALTIESLLKSDYPGDKLQVFAIDDGSKDDTRYWIRYAAERSGGKVTPVFLDRNGGKKAALYKGMKLAKSEVVVTLDSDSIVRRDSLRNLVAPFQNPRVGAVAGNIRVMNDQNIFGKMLDVSFAFTFDFMRCAQSSFGGTVLCTPGALSAYRLTALLPVIDEWLNQVFMGAPSTIGEDRALSSLILLSNYQVRFQQNAIACTTIPTTYVRICRMYLRWIRSDIRENIRMARAVLTGTIRHWSPRMLVLQANLLFLDLSILAPLVAIPGIVSFLIVHLANLPMILMMMLLASLGWAVIPAVIYAERYSPLKSLWAFGYCVFYFFGLSWVPIYSIFTLRNGSWMTRELAQQGREDQAAAKIEAVGVSKN